MGIVGKVSKRRISLLKAARVNFCCSRGLKNQREWISFSSPNLVESQMKFALYLENIGPFRWMTQSSLNGLTLSQELRLGEMLLDILTRRHFKRMLHSEICTRKGTFRCGGCSYCMYLDISSSIQLPNGNLLTLGHYIDCSKRKESFI